MTPDRDAEIGDALRRELAAEADSIMPATDGLDRIRSRIAIRRGRSGLLGWWPAFVDLLRPLDGRMLRPSLAAAGAAIIAIAALASVPGVRQLVSSITSSGGSSAPQPGGPGGGAAGGTSGSPASSANGTAKYPRQGASTGPGAVPVVPPVRCSPHSQPTSASTTPAAPGSSVAGGGQQSSTGKPAPSASPATQCPASGPPQPAQSPSSPGTPATQPAVPSHGSGGAGQGSAPSSTGQTSTGAAGSAKTSTGNAGIGQAPANGTVGPGTVTNGANPSLGSRLIPGTRA
jgi:hypothetical protein